MERCACWVSDFWGLSIWLPSAAAPLTSHQPSIRAPISPHSHQHWLVSGFCLFEDSHPNGRKWYLTVVSIWISQSCWASFHVHIGTCIPLLEKSLLKFFRVGLCAEWLLHIEVSDISSVTQLRVLNRSIACWWLLLTALCKNLSLRQNNRPGEVLKNPDLKQREEVSRHMLGVR